MVAIHVLLALMTQSVGISVEDTRGVSGDEVRALVADLSAAIAKRAGPTKIDDGPRCERPDRCLDDLRRRTGAADLVLVRMIGVPTRIRVMVTRLTETGVEMNARVDAERNRATWPGAARRVAATLFEAKPVEAPPPPAVVAAPPPPPSLTSPPTAPPPVAVVAPPPVDAPSSGSSVLPWVVVGVGVVAMATGIGFGASSANARNTAATTPTSHAELADLEARAIGHGWAANISFGVSAVAIAGGVVWLLVD